MTDDDDNLAIDCPSYQGSGASLRKLNNSPLLESSSTEREDMKKTLERLAADARKKYEDAMRFLDMHECTDELLKEEEEEEDVCGGATSRGGRGKLFPQGKSNKAITIHAELVIVDCIMCSKCKK